MRGWSLEACTSCTSCSFVLPHRRDRRSNALLLFLSSSASAGCRFSLESGSQSVRVTSQHQRLSWPSSSCLLLPPRPPPASPHPSIHLRSHPPVNVAVDSLQILPALCCSFHSSVLIVDILLKHPPGRGVHNIFTSPYVGGTMGWP